MGGVVCLLFSSAVNAEVEWYGNGFGTLGAGVLNSNSINEVNPFQHNGYDDSLQLDVDTRLGYQGILQLDDQVSVTAQAVVQSSDDFEADLEWVYLTYKVNGNLFFNVGRIRRPSYNYSDYLDVGYAYPWIRPPVEVYSRDLAFYDQVDGISFLYERPIGGWISSVQAYYGGSSDNSEVSFGENVDFKTRDDRGVFLGLENDYWNFRLGYQVLPSISVGRIEQGEALITALEGAGFGDIGRDLDVEDIRTEFYEFFIGLDINDWFCSAEYVRVLVSKSAAPNDEAAWYLTGGRRLGPLTLHYTYAERERENERRFSGPIREQASMLPPAFAGPLIALADAVDEGSSLSDTKQKSHTVGLRYDFDKAYALKLEYQIISDQKNDLTNNLVSVAVDFIF